MDGDALNAFMTEAFGQPLSWTIERVDADGITVRQPTGTGDLRPGGTISGPTLMSMADGVAYMVVLSRIGPAALAVTSSLNINFLRRPRPVDLVTESRLLKLGRSLAVVEVEMYSDDGSPDALERPVAQATVTYSLALLGLAGLAGSDAAADTTDTTTPTTGSNR